MLKRYTQLRRSYDHTFFYGLATSAINALSSGALVTAFAVTLGAGNVALGFLWAVQPMSSLMHLPVSYFIEKGASLKKIAVFSSLICRPFWLIAASVVFLKGQMALTVFVISYFFAFIIWSVSGGAFYPWIKQLVHPRLINRFLAHRIKYILLTKTLIASLAAGVIWMIQKYRPDWEIYSYAVFFVLAFLFGLEATWHLGRMADRKITTVPEKSFVSKVLFTLKNDSFKRLLLSLSAVNFSMNFIMPFIMVFMLKQLGLSVGVSMAFTILCQLTDCFTLARWSARASRKGVGRTMME
ncbi:MAG: hypothetical protein ACI4QM_02685, partial [Alphaproteobacteria bacterium]